MSKEPIMVNDPKDGSPSPRRLGDYDTLRAQLAADKEYWITRERQLLDKLQAERLHADSLAKALESAVSALRSYQYGNSSPELAEEVANHCVAALTPTTAQQNQS